jgi:hypothetical protein
MMGRNSPQPYVEDIKTAAFLENPLIRTLTKRSQWRSASIQGFGSEFEQCSTSQRFPYTSAALVLAHLLRPVEFLEVSPTLCPASRQGFKNIVQEGIHKRSSWALRTLYNQFNF